MTEIILMLHIVVAMLLAAVDEPIVVDRPGFEITRSGNVRVSGDVLPDANAVGAIVVRGDDLTLDFAGAELRGAPADVPGDTLRGTGLRITGRNVTIRRLKVSGYKCGIHADQADGLTLERCDVSGNFRQRLRSTPRAEDQTDWLWPHKNDDHEWLRNYGAGVYIERSRGVTVRECVARRGQNGLILDRVTGARVYDNDFSFLSGWGLALWRSSGNLISRNAFDFCVRGYSHGVYNRGQDSAGILMFEQCCDNVIAENSATHGGDGFFGFAGHEALGETPAPAADFDYKRRGCNNNLLINNDFSFAVAHGIEITFSFGNRLVGNRLVEDGICGVWAGYSQDTLIAANLCVRDGQAGYALERGGVNIEHGRGNVIRANVFEECPVGVHLWWDEDTGLLDKPWVKANGAQSTDNQVIFNLFKGGPLAMQLRQSPRTLWCGNTLTNVARDIDASADSHPTVTSECDANWPQPEYEALGEDKTVGARPDLRGREKIIITEWGPYDWKEPYLQLVGQKDATHVYRLLGTAPPTSASVRSPVAAASQPAAEAAPRPLEPTPEAATRLPQFVVASPMPDVVYPYELSVNVGERTLQQRGTLVAATWAIRVFPWKTDPREDYEAWKREADAGLTFTAPQLDLRFGMRGPSDLPGVAKEVADAKLPRDRFGTIATTRLTIPAGKWKVSTTSDDGVRVWVDDRRVIDNWTWHGPTVDTAELDFAEPRTVELRVEHFELDGFAVLSLELAAP